MRLKKRWRIALVLVLLVTALGAYLAVTLNFTSSQNDETLCTGINVVISNNDELKLVTVDDVKSIIKSSDDKLIGKALKDIDVSKIQTLLESKSYIKSVNVYTTINGLLNVKLAQRVPAVRVHTNGGAFYMDTDGFVFPLSNAYTHYVPVVTGNIQLPFNLPYKGKLPEGDRSKILHDLLGFVDFLTKDSFWNAEIEQINVLPNTEIELIPRSGNHIIKLGTFDSHQYKLSKLYTFYKKVLPVEGWKKYSEFDLRYSNQVVAILSSNSR